MNGGEPATKADVRTSVHACEERLTGVIKAAEERLVENMRDVQTEMLKAFYNFAESNDRRIAQNEVNELANRSCIEAVERRVTEIEKRLNIPPAA